ncbi:MAG: hypothetical protein OXT65_10325 [Alphaproteobacteria bacterium]|nr:hypothetical protein [Alphaproteobacteria bacterium]
MPFEKKEDKKPEPALTPLDEALKEIENTVPEEAPVALMNEAPEEPEPAEEEVAEPAPAAIEQTPPPTSTAEVTLPPPEEEKKSSGLPTPLGRIVQVQPNASFFGLSIGMYDPFSHGRNAASFNVEWQPGVKIAGVLQPIFGAMMTTQGSLLGYGGMGVPIHVTDKIMLMPSLALGAYQDGDGFNLGQTLAYRVGTELAYVFDDRSRLGINAHVLTNGRSLERSDRTEILSLVYTTPLDVLSGEKKGALNR